MVAAYVDDSGDVRSAASGRIIAPAGTTPRQARFRAALWAAAADALQNTTPANSRAQAEPAPAPVTPLNAAPSFARTVGQARRTLEVIDVGHLCAETAAQLAAATGKDPSCH